MSLERAPRPAERRSGFTLIDLMMVIAILAILAALTLPLVGQHVDKAEQAMAESNLAAAQKAVQVYYTTHGRFPDELTNDLFTQGEPLDMPEGYSLTYDAATGDVTLVEP